MRDHHLPTRLNPALVARMDISTGTQDELNALHGRMNDLLTEIDANEDPAKDRDLADKVTALEFEMQTLWGFPVRADFHTHWLRPRRCSCSRLPYNILQKTNARIVSHDCPLHSDQTVEGLDTYVLGTDERLKLLEARG